MREYFIGHTDGVGDSHEHHRMDTDGHIIASDNLLNREIENGLAQVQIVREGFLVKAGGRTVHELKFKNGVR